jgi:hypothetical protein
VSADILKTIDDTLAWYGSEDSAQWTPPGAFPVLAEHQAETARWLSADTGMDGYAAWLMVADVVDKRADSPFLHPVLDAGRKVFPAPVAYSPSRSLESAAAGVFDRAIERLNAILAERAAEWGPLTCELNAGPEVRLFTSVNPAPPRPNGYINISGMRFSRAVRDEPPSYTWTPSQCAAAEEDQPR